MKKNIISSDYAKLKTVIIKSLSLETKRLNPLLPNLNRAGFPTDLIGSHSREEHKKFKQLLINNGVEVLEMNDLIDDALEETKKIGAFDKFLTKYYPEFSKLHKYERQALSAEDLIGAGQSTFYP